MGTISRQLTWGPIIKVIKTVRRGYGRVTSRRKDSQSVDDARDSYKTGEPPLPPTVHRRMADERSRRVHLRRLERRARRIRRLRRYAGSYR